MTKGISEMTAQTLADFPWKKDTNTKVEALHKRTPKATTAHIALINRTLTLCLNKEIRGGGA
jgi:hypothetical protein